MVGGGFYNKTIPDEARASKRSPRKIDIHDTINKAGILSVEGKVDKAKKLMSETFFDKPYPSVDRNKLTSQGKKYYDDFHEFEVRGRSRYGR